MPDSLEASGSREGLHGHGEGLSEAIKKKDKERAERNATRRRVRGGALPPGSGRTRSTNAEDQYSALDRSDLRDEVEIVVP